ncbi:MAG: ROK family protein [Thermoguttaceae bacterium]
MFLGIEIGGTKLQLGVGRGDGPPLAALARLDVEPQSGAERIRRQIQEVAGPLIRQYGVRRIGIGFGGPVDAQRGRVILSHQVEGWRDFPLVDWAQQTLGLPAILANDSDSAGLAEARFGAGKHHRVVFYNNIGSGIGGALVIDGQLYQGSTGVASEIGHLRPGLEAQTPKQDLESIASGWALAAAARSLVQRSEAADPYAAALLARCHGRLERLDARLLAQAAEAGNPLAAELFDRTCRAIGWAVAQAITLLAPNVVVMGGGVSLAGEAIFLAPLRRYVAQYVFPPLAGTYQILPAALGEEVVVHGVLALAATCPASWGAPRPNAPKPSPPPRPETGRSATDRRF